MEKIEEKKQIAKKHLEEIANYAIPAPRLGNKYLEDVALLTYLQIFIERDQVPIQQIIQMQEDLTKFGQKVISSEYMQMCQNAELHQPVLEQFDGYGKRIDTIHTSEGWKFFKKEAALEGLIAIAYNNRDEQNNIKHKNARLHQLIKLMLFSDQSGMVSCPLAMTDGAAFTLREVQKEGKYWFPEIQEAMKHLTSTDPKKFWTSGQWMTEKKGGSDVSQGTSTLAIEESNKEKCYLYGFKWFTSATDSDMTLTLARYPQNQEELEKNTGKLAMTFVKVKDKYSRLNKIQVVRLKNKLGTKQLPTAELILNGTEGKRISDVGVGIKWIANMLNITRVHTGMGALANMRKIIALANDYKERRSVFGKKLSEHQVHINILARLEKIYRGNLLLFLETSLLLQQIENGDKTKFQEFRLMTPILKVMASKDSMHVISEGLECFGGIGYIETSGIPKIFRDAQVNPIWEGTTNTLSLDFVNEIFKNFDQCYKLFEKQLTFTELSKGRIDSMATQEKINQIYKVKVSDFLKSLESLKKSNNQDLIKSQSRSLLFNYALILINKIFLNRIMPVHYEDQGEIEVFHFWIDRLNREYRSILDKNDQDKLFENDKRILRGEFYGRDFSFNFAMRNKL